MEIILHFKLIEFYTVSIKFSVNDASFAHSPVP